MDALLRGAWDVHVHAGPSLFPRWGDGWDLASAATEAKMAGVVIKAHHGETVSCAALLDGQFSSLTVRGGLALNAFCGGLNPLAVERCLALGGRIVWMPTIHAAHHGEVMGKLGGFSFQNRPLRHTPTEGLRIVDDSGALLPAVSDILALVGERDGVVGTGHLSPAEIRVLQRAVIRDHRRVRLLINHALFWVPALSIDQLRDLAHERVTFELCYLSLTEMTRATTASIMTRALAALPDARWVLASDSGQAGNPPSPVCLSRFAAALSAAGVTTERLSRMLRDGPCELFA